MAQRKPKSIENPTATPGAQAKSAVSDTNVTPTVHEEIYGQLKHSIVSGQLEPGRALTVRGLAGKYGVSAMPVREAIKRLVGLGALEQTPTRRIMVAQMTQEKFIEITVARKALEPALAVLALRKLRLKPAKLEKLVALLGIVDAKLDGAIETGNVADYGKYNSEFHFALYNAAKAPVMIGLVESLWLQIGPFMRIVLGRQGTASLVDQHKEIIAALKARDTAKLEEAMRDDIMDGMSQIEYQLQAPE